MQIWGKKWSLNYKILSQKSGHWSLKTGGLLMQVKVIVITLGRTWRWSLSTGGLLIEVVFRSSLTVSHFGVGIRIASCLHSISWTNGWILTKLAQTHYLDGGEEVIRFWWLWWSWPHFQGPTSTLNYQILTKKSLSAPYLLNQWWILAKLHVF